MAVGWMGAIVPVTLVVIVGGIMMWLANKKR
jgi:hypothetical protein